MLVDVGDTVIVNVKPIDCPVKLVLLDVGITASLSEEDRQNFRNVFKAVVLGDVSFKNLFNILIILKLYLMQVINLHSDFMFQILFNMCSYMLF
jgi:hypothetical protein